MATQKEMDRLILEQLNQYHAPLKHEPKPKPDLHREGTDWWESHTSTVEEHCDEQSAIDSLRAKGITHITRYQNSCADSKATEWYNQYVDATGKVIVEEMC